MKEAAPEGFKSPERKFILPKEGLIKAETPPQEKEKDEEQETLMNLEEFLKEIDFKSLKSIYEEIYIKVGIDPEKLNFPGDNPNNIGELRTSWLNTFLRSGTAEGIYNNITNRIHIRLEDKAEDLREDISSKIAVLHTLIHELNHAASDWQKGFKGVWQGGYGRGNSFRGLNEAVTERLAQEISVEYIRRTAFAGGLGAWKALAENHLQTYPHLIKESGVDPKIQIYRVFFDREFGSYKAEREVLQKMIEIIGQDAGVAKETVWQGFVRSYFEQERLDNPELRALLDEVFHPGFIKKLKGFKDDKKSIEELFDKQFTESLRERLMHWFTNLGSGSANQISKTETL